MINTRKELKFYIAADLMMNIGSFKLSLIEWIELILGLNDRCKWLIKMRKCSYWSTKSGLGKLIYRFKLISFYKLSKRLGFTIGINVFGYGLVIPHYGTIVVGGGNNQIGNYASLNTSICISINSKEIGDGLYVGTGAKIISKVKLGDNISVGANSVVNKSIDGDNLLIVGAPAKNIKNALPWYEREGFIDRVNLIEELKRKYKI